MDICTRVFLLVVYVAYLFVNTANNASTVSPPIGEEPQINTVFFALIILSVAISLITSYMRGRWLFVVAR